MTAMDVIFPLPLTLPVPVPDRRQRGPHVLPAAAARHGGPRRVYRLRWLDGTDGNFAQVRYGTLQHGVLGRIAMRYGKICKMQELALPSARALLFSSTLIATVATAATDNKSP